MTFLTFVRFPLVLVFFGLAIAYSLCGAAWMFPAALVAIVAGAVTDLFDGYFARRFRVETRFGAHADPLMDKFFYLATLPLLVFVAARDGNIRHAIVLLGLTILFLTRDQWATFLRSIGSLRGVAPPAAWSDRARAAINFPLICCIYYFEESPARTVSPALLYMLEAAAAAVNLASVYIYTRHYRPCLAEAMEPVGDNGK